MTDISRTNGTRPLYASMRQTPSESAGVPIQVKRKSMDSTNSVDYGMQELKFLPDDKKFMSDVSNTIEQRGFPMPRALAAPAA